MMIQDIQLTTYVFSESKDVKQRVVLSATGLQKLVDKIKEEISRMSR